ncbi:MAG: CBS domain-containing protein [Planctomycetes bacterium]|nr:CBS domain-containing protein [Planctomycetota bacterium]
MQTVSDVLKGRTLFSVQRGQTVFQVARFMSEKKIGAVVVLEGDRLAGLFSERDIMNRVVAQGRDPAKTVVDDVMTKEVVVAEAGDSWDAALAQMKKINVRHLPVIDGGRLVGMLSLRDLLLSTIEVKEEEIKWLEQTVAVSSTAGVDSAKYLTWRCLGCGHVLTARKPPTACPKCGKPKEEFENVEED